MADSDLQQQPDPAPAEQDGFSAAFKEATAPSADGDKPTAKEPAPEAGSAEAPAPADATVNSEPAEKADPLADLSPEQLRQRLNESEAERERLRTLERRQRGTVGALTRKLNNLSTPAPTPAPAKQEEQSTAEGEGKTAADLDKELQKAIDEYPDVVGPLAQRQKQLQDTVESLRGQIEQIGKVATTRDEVEADAAELTEALEALEKVHPDRAEFNQGNAQFVGWLEAQSPKVIELANSYDPREVSLALTLYKTERSAALAKSSEGGDRKDTSATDERRQRQIDGSRQVHSRGAPAAAGVPNEFSSAWKARVAVKT